MRPLPPSYSPFWLFPCISSHPLSFPPQILRVDHLSSFLFYYMHPTCLFPYILPPRLSLPLVLITYDDMNISHFFLLPHSIISSFLLVYDRLSPSLNIIFPSFVPSFFLSSPPFFPPPHSFLSSLFGQRPRRVVVL